MKKKIKFIPFSFFVCILQHRYTTKKVTFFIERSNIRNYCSSIHTHRYLFKIHKGQTSIIIRGTKYQSGFKFGEFAFTRKPFYYPLRKKKR